MKKYLLLISCIVTLIACTGNKAQYEKTITSLRDSVRILQHNIVALNSDLEGYRNSPAKLLASMQRDYSNKSYSALNDTYALLIKYHPESKEVADAKVILDKVAAEQARLAAEQKAAEEKAKQERMKAVTKLKKQYDDVSGITWYNQPYFTHYNFSNKTSLYIGQSANTVWLRLKMSYGGDDWIFFEHAYLSYDGTTVEIPFNEYQDKKTDNTDTVWEWIDVSVSPYILTHLRALCNAKIVKMRLSGKYTQTRALTQQEIQGIKDILLAYDVLENGI